MISLDPTAFWALFIFAVFGVLAFITTVAVIAQAIAFGREGDAATRWRETLVGSQEKGR